MKTYNQTNFFKHTFCEFTQVDDFQFPKENYFKSKSESMYFYADEGVYRKSNHWGRVANCRWNILTNKKYKNQQIIIGFAKWSNFYPINSSEKLFWIKVDFKEKEVKINPKLSTENKYLFHLSTAQQKAKEIRKLFSEEKWANYFDIEIDELRKKLITKFINSDHTIFQIKSEFKST